MRFALAILAGGERSVQRETLKAFGLSHSRLLTPGCRADPGAGLSKPLSVRRNMTKHETGRLCRRSFLAAAPAAAVTGALPAAAETDTPVMRLFREWRAFTEWLEGPQSNSVPQAEYNAMCGQAAEMLDEIIAAPSMRHADTALKLFAVIENGELLYDMRHKDALYSEARALVA